jgi:hypothetical protein
MANNNHSRTSNIKPFTPQGETLAPRRDDSNLIVLFASGNSYKPGDLRKVRPENVPTILEQAKAQGVRYWNPKLGLDSGKLIQPVAVEDDAPRVPGRPYACVEMTTGQGFLNNQDAAKIFGVNLGGIYSSCLGGYWTKEKTRKFRFAKPSEIEKMTNGEWVAVPEIK